MKKRGNVFRRLREEMASQLSFYVDEASDASVFILPFKDNLGDNLVIRLRDNEQHYVVDDGGLTSNTLFVISETTGGVKSGKLASSLISSFGAHLNKAEGLVELTAGYYEVVPKMLHFIKMLLTLDTMLGEVVKEEREIGRPQRQSLGPRASQKLRKPLNPLIKLGQVSYRFLVDGLTVPDWMVDFAYEPVPPYLAPPAQMVLYITVDLAVVDPVLKATYAFSRAIDIKAAHKDYDIRIAFDAHGQNSTSASAARFLSEHQIDTKAYTAIDLSKKQELAKLVNRVNSEIGMPLAE